MGTRLISNIGANPVQIADGSKEIKFNGTGKYYQGMRYCHGEDAPGGLLNRPEDPAVEYGGAMKTWVWSENDKYPIDVIIIEED